MSDRLDNLRRARDFWRQAHAQPDNGTGTRRDALGWILDAVDRVLDGDSENRWSCPNCYRDYVDGRRGVCDECGYGLDYDTGANT